MTNTEIKSKHMYHMQILDSAHTITIIKLLAHCQVLSCTLVINSLFQAPATSSHFRVPLMFWGLDLVCFPCWNILPQKTTWLALHLIHFVTVSPSLRELFWPLHVIYQNKTLPTLSIPLHYFLLALIFYSAFPDTTLFLLSMQFSSIKSMILFYFLSSQHLNSTWHIIGIQWH